MARKRRLKITDQVAVYHCISRVVAGELLLDNKARQVLCRQIWQVADFCGVEVLCHCVMSNHFHLLVKVPEKEEPTPDELARRWAVLYSRSERDRDLMRQFLVSGLPEAKTMTEALRKRMGDISAYLKELKQRHTIWYNRNHGRFGTLWAERFKSLLVEASPQAVQTVAAYITLNPVRAGLCEDPKDYRWCSYAEAVKGLPYARRGLAQTMDATGRAILVSPLEPVTASEWQDAQARFRVFVFMKGAVVKEGRASISTEAVNRVISEQGRIDPTANFSRRICRMADGVILGSLDFLQRVAAGNALQGKRPFPPQPMSGQAGSLHFWRRGLQVRSNGFQNRSI